MRSLIIHADAPRQCPQRVDLDGHSGLCARASEHRGKFGQLTSPTGKMDEKLKSENMQKEQFCEYFESNRCRQV